MRKRIKNLTPSIAAAVLAVLIAVFFAGRWSGAGSNAVHEIQHEESAGAVWTCSMHPEIRQNEPGYCPICGMELIPVSSHDNPDAFSGLVMSQTAMTLAGVQTELVKRGNAEKQIRLTGRVVLDPQYAFAQNPHISGRIEEMLVNNVGDFVEKGDAIAVIYSPELLNTQRELLQAYEHREAEPAVYQAVRRKLKLWKIEDRQIDNIIEKGEPGEFFTIFADNSGYVIQKKTDRGEHVEEGTDLFLISQLENLRGLFEVYEKDVPFIKEGMPLEYSLIADPGKKYSAEIDFVEPLFNPETRTLSARIRIPNPDGIFKPDMFLNGIVHAELENGADKIIIPKSAVMWTGKKSVVYVKQETDHQIGFVMRQVTLGPSLGSGYVIEDGLAEGEEIVVQGTFSVDAAAQLSGARSMMNNHDEMHDEHRIPDEHGHQDASHDGHTM